METGFVFNVQRFSIHDGPGIRTTVFLKGCPLRCAWCHNPESQHFVAEHMFRGERCIACDACLSACDAHAVERLGDHVVVDEERCRLCGACAAACPTEARQIVGRRVSASELAAEAARDSVFFDQSGGGVTLSGGEPLAQPEFCLALLAELRCREIHTTLDTSGYAPAEVIERVSPCVDLVLYDLKLIDDARHVRHTGVSNALILSNLRRLVRLGARVRVRVPVVPGVNDGNEDVAALGAFVASLSPAPPVDLLAYHRIGLDKYRRLNRESTLDAIEPPSAERMAEIAQRLRRLGLDVTPEGKP